MKPIPDHGETSYIGSGKLAGKKALITGGDSGIGRAVAIAYAREGADVAIGYLPEEESDAASVIALIRAEGRKAVAIPGDIRGSRSAIRWWKKAVGTGWPGYPGEQRRTPAVLRIDRRSHHGRFRRDV